MVEGYVCVSHTVETVRSRTTRILEVYFVFPLSLSGCQHYIGEFSNATERPMGELKPDRIEEIWLAELH